MTYDKSSGHILDQLDLNSYLYLVIFLLFKLEAFIKKSELRSCYINVVLLINVSEAYITFIKTQIKDLFHLYYI